MAKAPIPGLAKTRLIPTIGAHAAAVLQERLTERAVATAFAADIGPVTLWCTPDPNHVSFRDLAARFPLNPVRQAEGDLGARMLAAIAAYQGPTLVIGTDCPALRADELRVAAHALQKTQAVLIPAEDGGYVLIGLRRVQPQLFTDVVWGTADVFAETQTRIVAMGLTCTVLSSLWDVDTEDDLARLESTYPELAL